MTLYEHVFLARQDLSQQQVDALVEQYRGIIEADGGSIGRVENWGLKVPWLSGSRRTARPIIR